MKERGTPKFPQIEKQGSYGAFAEKVASPMVPTLFVDRQTELEHTFKRFLELVDPTRDLSVGTHGTSETPHRAAKAWLQQWAAGYRQDPMEIMKVFEDGAEGYCSSVCVEEIEVYSHCEHHLAPIIGKALVAYIPNGKILGLSKLNRLVDVYARRLQVQERLTTQIADALDAGLEPHGVAVFIRARHLCMESRGVRQNSVTSTQAFKGVFAEGLSGNPYEMEMRLFMERCASLKA